MAQLLNAEQISNGIDEIVHGRLQTGFVNRREEETVLIVLFNSFSLLGIRPLRAIRIHTPNTVDRSLEHKFNFRQPRMHVPVVNDRQHIQGRDKRELDSHRITGNSTGTKDERTHRIRDSIHGRPHFHAPLAKAMKSVILFESLSKVTSASPVV